MAMIVKEKNEGAKIPYTVKGSKITFDDEIMLNLENTGLRFAIDALIKALLEAEETIIAEDGE